MDRFISLGLWAAVALAFVLVFGALNAEAGERNRRGRVVAVETLESQKGYRAPCPRVNRYRRDMGNCRQAWERPRPIFVVQPKPPAARRKIVD